MQLWEFFFKPVTYFIWHTPIFTLSSKVSKLSSKVTLLSKVFCSGDRAFFRHFVDNSTVGNLDVDVRTWWQSLLRSARWDKTRCWRYRKKKTLEASSMTKRQFVPWTRVAGRNHFNPPPPTPCSNCSFSFTALLTGMSWSCHRDTQGFGMQCAAYIRQSVCKDIFFVCWNSRANFDCECQICYSPRSIY
jgi:hypothetical protein